MTCSMYAYDASRFRYWGSGTKGAHFLLTNKTFATHFRDPARCQTPFATHFTFKHVARPQIKFSSVPDPKSRDKRFLYFLFSKYVPSRQLEAKVWKLVVGVFVGADRQKLREQQWFVEVFEAKFLKHIFWYICRCRQTDRGVIWSRC